MREKDVKITPSIIDRLIDYEPSYSSDTAKSGSQSLKELKLAVRRDIEWLLNSRHSLKDLPDGLKEVKNSLAVYGIPDFTGMSSKDSDQQAELLGNIEAALRVFEPRLANLKISVDRTDIIRRGVIFRIEGILKVDPTPEPIVFDTVLTVGNGEFEVVETD